MSSTLFYILSYIFIVNGWIGNKRMISLFDFPNYVFCINKKKIAYFQSDRVELLGEKIKHQMPKRKRRKDFRYRNHYYKDYYPDDSEHRYSENWRSVRRPQSRYPQDSGSESNNWRKFKVKQKEEFTSRMNAAIIQILQYVITAY